MPNSGIPSVIKNTVFSLSKYRIYFIYLVRTIDIHVIRTGTGSLKNVK